MPRLMVLIALDLVCDLRFGPLTSQSFVTPHLSLTPLETVNIKFPLELKACFFHLRISFCRSVEVTSSILMMLFLTRRAIIKDSKEYGSDDTKTNVLVFSSIFLPTLKKLMRIL